MSNIISAKAARFRLTYCAASGIIEQFAGRNRKGSIHRSFIGFSGRVRNIVEYTYCNTKGRNSEFKTAQIFIYHQ